MHQLLSIVGTWWPALIISGNDAEGTVCFQVRSFFK